MTTWGIDVIIVADAEKNPRTERCPDQKRQNSLKGQSGSGINPLGWLTMLGVGYITSR